MSSLLRRAGVVTLVGFGFALLAPYLLSNASAVAADDPTISELCAANPAACTVMTEQTGGSERAPEVGSLDDAVQGVPSPDVDTKKSLTAIREFTPENAVESWAQASAEGAVSILGKVDGWQQKVSAPAFDRDWWQSQYAIMFALSLLVFAFLLVVVVAKVGGPEGTVSAAQLLRDSGVKVWLVPVLLAVGPVVLTMLQSGATELAKSFAVQAEHGSSNVTADFLAKMTSVSSGFDSFGGALLALLILLGILVFAVAVLIEVAVASWGLNLLGLVVPLAVVMHVYPPWRRPLARIAGLMLGLLFAPAAVNFVYWTFWSTASGLGGDLDLFGISLYVLIGTFFLAIAPIVLMWLFPLALPVARPAGDAVAGTRARETSEPRTLNRLAGHFRTKEAPSAHAPVLHAPEHDDPRLARTAVQAGPHGAAVSQRHRAASQEAAVQDVYAGAGEADARIGDQLGKKSSAETFDPEPFEPPGQEPRNGPLGRPDGDGGTA